MEPILRKEMFMAKAAGQNVNVPEPITREEKYLAAIAASGGGGILLYAKNSRLYKDERCAENDEVSKEEALAYARSAIVVKEDGIESYMLVTSVYSQDNWDYATVNTSGVEFYTKEFSSGGPM